MSGIPWPSDTDLAADEEQWQDQESAIRRQERISAKAEELRILADARSRVAAEQAVTVTLPSLWRLDEFLARPRRQAEYRVPGLWPSGGRVVLAAQQKAGKTTLVANLLRSLVDGDRFLDADALPAERVVLLDAELDDGMLQDWLYDQSIQRREVVHGIAMRGRLSTFNILNADLRARWAEHLGPADVLIVDCLRPFLDALGLSEDKEAGRFLEALDELTAAAGIRETLLVHHMGHSSERSRGDSRILDWPDAVWKLIKDTEQPDEPRYFSAYGRDVAHAETLLGYEQPTRRLYVSGGSRRDGKVGAVLAPLLDLLAETAEPLSGRAIEERMKGEGRDQVRAALKRGIREGRILTEDGPRNATLHYLNPSVRGSAREVRGRTEIECASALYGSAHSLTRVDGTERTDLPAHSLINQEDN